MQYLTGKKIVLVTNHLTPYRRKFYDDFFIACKNRGIEFRVLLMTQREPKRNWDYEKLKVDYAYLMNGSHFSFPINNHLNYQVVAILKEIKPDIILMAGSYMYYTNWLVLLFKKTINAPIIYWNEAHFNEKRNYNKLTFTIRDLFRNFIFNCFDGYWYSGQMSKDFVAHYSKHNAKFYFLPNLIDNEVYKLGSNKNDKEIVNIKTRLNIPLQNKVIIIPARLSEEKGIHLVIEYLTKVKNKQKVTVLIPGTGPFKHVIEDLILKSGLDIRLLGFQNQDFMIELYSIANIFMLPSLSDPNPLTCIEALWCGLPLFISNHVGNYPEVVQEGKNGFVFDYSESREAINKLDIILQSTKDWFNGAKITSLEIANSIYKPDIVIENVLNEMSNDFF
jgi:glycosyltransferase involved in cell wall biosynthesis